MAAVLITGASSGIGAALATRFAKRGDVIGLVGRRADALTKVSAEVQGRGGRAVVLPTDVTDSAAMARTVDEFASAAGHLDVVIANAGVGEQAKGARFDAKEVARVFEVNCIGVTNTLLPCLPRMRRQGSGVLVGMASIAGYRAMPGSLAYSASKAAVITLMEGLAMELQGTGIHAMSIQPGFIRTPLTSTNEFPMPFLMDADEAASRMVRAIERRVASFDFPLPFVVGRRLLRAAPRALLLKLLPRVGGLPPLE